MRRILYHNVSTTTSTSQIPSSKRKHNMTVVQHPKIRTTRHQPLSFGSLLLICTSIQLQSVLFVVILLPLLIYPIASIDAFTSDSVTFGYIPNSDVTKYLQLALDIKSMRKTTSFEEKHTIYEKGNHSSISLASLSLTAGTIMTNVPIYNLYINTFRELGIVHENDSVGSFDGHPVEEYANTLIEDLFQLEIPHIEATASVIHSVYMSFWSFLYQILYHCENIQNTNTTIASFSTPNDMFASLDAAVALYVGEGQIRNDAQYGYMIYNLAEYVGSKFNQKGDSGETFVNTKIMNLFLSIQQDILKNKFCTDPTKFDVEYRTLRQKVHDVMKLSNIVLIQTVLHFLQDVYDTTDNYSVSNPTGATTYDGTTNAFVELVALAIHPQVDSCNIQLSTNITNLLITHPISSKDEPLTSNQRNGIIQTLQDSFSCLHVTCTDIGSYEYNVIRQCTNDDKTTVQPLYSNKYIPDSSVTNEILKINYDIRQIHIFLQFNKWDLVQNYYTYGWNTYFSLYDIAIGNRNFTSIVKKSNDFMLYQKYDENYYSMYGGTGHTLIQYALDEPIPSDVGILDNTKPISANNTITDPIRIGIISGTIETYVMIIGIFSNFDAAIDLCLLLGNGNDSEINKVLQYWDTAAAFMIGTSEIGEYDTDSGQSIFTLSKRFCYVFDTCEPTGTISNTVLLAALNAGADAIVGGDCEQARTFRNGKIKVFLFIPIIQGLIYYTIEAAREQSGTGSDSKGYLIAYTMALLPYIEKVDKDSALLLNSAIELDEPINVADTFYALRAALPLLNIDCALIGQISINGNKTGVCADDAPISTLPPEVVVSPTTSPSLQPIYVPDEKLQEDGLTWGRYNFTNVTIAIMDANFTLDVRDMWFAENARIAEGIYLNASSYAVHGLYRYSNITSLQDFSTKASLYMNQDPIYNFYRVALFDDDTFEANVTGADNGWPYADAIEQLAVGPTNGNNAQLGSKAVAVIEFYMMILHRLYESVRQCALGINSHDLIDAAVGLWIGQEQGEGKFNSGWSMYSVAQDALEFYGVKEMEAPVNTKLMEQFVDAQKLARSCDSNAEAPILLRQLVYQMVHNLTVPLAQHMLFHMSDNNLQFVELYALAFIPQTISVDEGAYDYLRDALFQGFSWESTVDEYFLSILGKALHAMRFTCNDLGNVTNANDNLKHLVSVLCNEIQYSYNSTFMVGYETSYDVSEWARFDLDIHQIDLFLRVNAFALAYEVYSKGRNSLGEDGKRNTLQFLTTTDELVDAGDLYKAYQDYYPQPKYADDMITEAIKNRTNGRFKAYSRLELIELVRRTFQTMAMYIPIHALLWSAIDECNTNLDGDKPLNNLGEGIAGQKYVDQAVALFVGSIEGPYSGGSPFGSGQMMYSLGVDICPYFSTCDIHGDSQSNIFLLFGFSSMKENLDNYRCDEAEKILVDNILTALPVPLIQGAIYYSFQSDPMAAVASDVLAETLLPQIYEVSQENVEVIYKETNVDFNDPPSHNQPYVIINAFKSLLDPLHVDCTFVGTLAADDGNYTFCENVTMPITNSTTDLPDNLYAITTDVQEKTNIALDIKELLQDISLNRLSSAKDLYNDGRNYEVYDAKGNLVGIRSIASFSTNAKEAMKSNPIQQISVYALQDDSGKFMGKDASQFADTIVQKMFEASGTSKSTLAVEAAVALNIWMELTNDLFQLVAKCRDEEINSAEGEKIVDGAVAYWVGGGQSSKSRDSGYLLYALAESVGGYFTVNSAINQARTNTNILRLFNAAKDELATETVCTSDRALARQLRRIVDKIVTLMIVVNVQALIHYLLVNNERDRVFIYSHAVVPLVAGCSPQTFMYLKEKLLDNKYTDDDLDDIITAIRSTFSCFGIRCDDVGIHFSEQPTVCADPSPTTTLADYKPSSDVQEYAKLDLDILELDILMRQRAYEAAYELYLFGKHASLGSSSDDVSISLADLATSVNRSKVPEYSSYVRYFSSDSQYANTLVRSALDSSGRTDLQRRVQVLGISMYMITYVSILQAMQEAREACLSTGEVQRNGVSITRWDQAAALIIGYLEGAKKGGSSEGRFFWSLSKRYCTEFNTCSVEETSSSRINDKITTYLFTGRSAVLDGSCDELDTTANDTSSLLLAAIFQGLFSAANKLSQRNTENKEEIQSEAFIYAQILVPLIMGKDENTANTIKDNFPFQGQALRQGLNPVVSALINSMSTLGVKCQYVGSSKEIDTCSGQTSQDLSPGAISGLIVGMITITAIALFILVQYKRRVTKRRNQNTAPVFTVSKGELNHHSDIAYTRTEQPVCAPSSFTSITQRAGDTNSSSDTYLMFDASDAMVEEEGMGVTQDAIMKVDECDEEYVRAVAAVLHDTPVV
jgi:hypothetical protein